MTYAEESGGCPTRNPIRERRQTPRKPRTGWGEPASEEAPLRFRYAEALRRVSVMCVEVVPHRGVRRPNERFCPRCLTKALGTGQAVSPPRGGRRD